LKNIYMVMSGKVAPAFWDTRYIKKFSVNIKSLNNFISKLFEPKKYIA